MNVSDLCEFDDITEQLGGDMIDIKISSFYEFEKAQPIRQGDYVLKDEQSQPVIILLFAPVFE